MKKLFYILLLLSSISYSQVCDSIRATKIEYLPVIVELPNMSKDSIYTKINSWVTRSFQNPDLVIKATEKHDYIRISGLASFPVRFMGTDTFYKLNYDLTIDIKDNKYRVSFLNVKAPEFSHGNFPKDFFNDEGELIGMKKVNLKTQKSVLQTLNSINFEIFNFILKPKDKF